MASRFCPQSLFSRCRILKLKSHHFARPLVYRNHSLPSLSDSSFCHCNFRSISSDSHPRFTSPGLGQGNQNEDEKEEEDEISEDEMNKYDEEDDEADDEEDDEDDEDGEDGGSVGVGANGPLSRDNKCVEKVGLANEIGYKVIGHFDGDKNTFKRYEPVFAVVQVGSHQFKVSNGDCIFTERLKFCEVNDKLVLNKVLLLGSSSQTIIGRPLLSDAAVYAVVEEHALDAKVIIFKKKRRKNYRRTRGHRQELTKLRIVDIHGIEKPKKITSKGKKNDKKLLQSTA